MHFHVLSSLQGLSLDFLHESETIKAKAVMGADDDTKRKRKKKKSNQDDNNNNSKASSNNSTVFDFLNSMSVPRDAPSLPKVNKLATSKLAAAASIRATNKNNNTKAKPQVKEVKSVF